MTAFVELASYIERAEAAIAKGVLEANDIAVLAPDLYTLGADPGLVFALGGYRLLVHESDADRARALLREIAAAHESSPD